MAKNLALKIAILQSGLSQIEVAKRLSIHESTLSHFVNGHHTPSDADQKALARILKRKPAELFPLEVAS